MLAVKSCKALSGGGKKKSICSILELILFRYIK